jgi:3-methyladenine DNA glycosylase AlkC
MKPEKKFEFSEVINIRTVQKIGTSIKSVWENFDAKKLEQKVKPKLSSLAFKDRANLIAEALYDLLPDDFGVAGQILLDAFGQELEDPDFTKEHAFMYMPHGVYVSRYGLEEAHFELSTQFLYEMTKRFSAEFAIRPFLNKFPQKMLHKLQAWVKDENQHVRRLVSEGTRPRLPWAARVKAYDENYKVIMDLLAALRNDSELYVRRSVANHLNDLTKDRKDLVLDNLEAWNKNSNKNIEWLTKHALRTLVKAGDVGALKILGFSENPQIEVLNFELEEKALKLGEKLVFSFDVQSEIDKKQSLVIDYIVYFKKSNGSQSPKVFKLKVLDLEGNKIVQLNKKQTIQQLSTRVLYEGMHAVELQINGKSFGKKDFELTF